MSETINLGIVGIKNMGEYNSETQYEKLNVVTYQGSSYCATKNTKGNLPTNPDYWQLYASKGATGDTGPKGDTGNPGPKGDTGNPGSSPLVASSMSDMTDTSRIYVLTTDGHWYYYNGTNWADGGIYQATGIGNGTVHESSFTTNLKESTILKDISTNHNVGKFINDNGVLVDNVSFTYSDLFDIPAFQTLHIRARGYLQNISMIAIYDDNNNYIGDHVLSIDSVVRDYKYINNTSTTLHARVSYANNTLVDLYLSNENNKDLSNLNENVGLYLNYKNIVPTFVQNYFVDRYGAISENRSFEYSNPIELKANETIRFYGKGYLDAISLISICNENNTSRTPVIISTNSNPDYFEYTASTDIYVCLCSTINIFNNCIIYNKKDGDKNNIPNTSFISSFLKLGVIGDSLASGETVYRDSNLIQHFIDNYDISWGQYLARKYGNTVINFSAGGLSTRTWLTSNYGLTKALLPENLCTGYIIGLGVNDYYHLGQNYLGTISDIKQDYNENPDTFYGNYGKIIGNIKSITKNAKIFILTMPNEINASQTKLNYNQAIRNIANHYGPTNNVFLIDLANLYVDEFAPNSFISNCERGGHYNSIAYNYMGDLLEKAISEYMYNNYKYFKEVEYINTDYKW